MSRKVKILSAAVGAAVVSALVVFESGSAGGKVALPPNSVGSLQVKDRSLLAKDFARRQLPRGLRGPAGAQGARGPVGERAPQGPAGQQGPKGDAAVSAYAYVVPPEVSMHADPVLVTQQSRNFASVSNPVFGLYCLEPSIPLQPESRSWVASVEYSRSAAAGVTTAQPDAGLRCPEGTFGVRTSRLAPSPTPHWEPAWDVAFMVVVP
jgi:hypothetical protein